MKDTDESYDNGTRWSHKEFEELRRESQDSDSCFAEKNLALIRTWTTEQRRLEYASVQFELFQHHMGLEPWFPPKQQQIPLTDEIEIPIPLMGIAKYRYDLHNYGQRIRHVMQELDSAFLEIEIEERERIGGVFAPGVKQ